MFEESAASKKPAKKEAVKAAAPPKKEAQKAELKKEQSDEDEWGTAPKVAAGATAVAATAVIASKAQKAEESDYSADWGENDLMDKGPPAKPVAEVKHIAIPEKTQAQPVVK